MTMLGNQIRPYSVLYDIAVNVALHGNDDKWCYFKCVRRSGNFVSCLEWNPNGHDV